MAARVVVDSGILLATVLQETYSDRAKALIDAWIAQQTELAAPELLRYEIAAVLRNRVHRALIVPDDALQSRDTLLGLPITYHTDNMLVKRGYDLASRFNRPTAYDSQYLALAERLGCEFWTADQKLFNAVSANLSWVKWLGNFSP